MPLSAVSCLLSCEVSILAKRVVTLRLDEDMIDAINQQIGDNFTQRFEAMVTRCLFELPALEQRMDEVRADIRRERDRLYELSKMVQDLNYLQKDIEAAKFAFSIAGRRAQSIADTVEV